MIYTVHLDSDDDGDDVNSHHNQWLMIENGGEKQFDSCVMVVGV